MNSNITEIVEGTTKIRVPNGSISEKVPPKEPAFFNPKASLNRDFSIIAYSSFWKNFQYPKIFLDGLSGIGARSLRVANEIDGVDKVIANDINPKALDLAKESSEINSLKNFEISENETCRFFSLHSRKNNRGSIVDIDPFGSPSKYVDCGVRATMHGGLLSVTATDLQVLHGLFNNAAKRRYYGVPIKTKFSNEIAIRLIIGCIYLISSRLDITIQPKFVDNDMHYYRVYLKILNKPEQEDKMGFITYCRECGMRKTVKNIVNECELCKGKIETAGPLWIDKIFDNDFVAIMKNEVKNLTVNKKCDVVLEKCYEESDLQPTYYTLDEIASRMKSAPLKLDTAIQKLQDSGFNASRTSLNPTGFRTNCQINDILKIFMN
jgi:tRNA (guanine26-N2/guanine27-N2)-dimethyltransferase